MLNLTVRQDGHVQTLPTVIFQPQKLEEDIVDCQTMFCCNYTVNCNELWKNREQQRQYITLTSINDLGLDFHNQILTEDGTSLIPGHSKHTLRCGCGVYISNHSSLHYHHDTSCNFPSKLFRQKRNKLKSCANCAWVTALGQLWFWRCSILGLQVCARCHSPWSERDYNYNWTPVGAEISGGDMTDMIWLERLERRDTWNSGAGQGFSFFLHQELSFVTFATFCPLPGQNRRIIHGSGFRSLLRLCSHSWLISFCFRAKMASEHSCRRNLGDALGPAV